MKLVTALTFVIAAALAVGCEGMGKKQMSAKADVLNVSPTPAPMPSATPVAAAPIADAQPVAFSQPVAAPAAPVASPAASGSKTYTVKKGDTLFSIAKNQLGTGRDWQKIVSANPGLTPQKLKVGQQIVMPS